MGVISIFFSDLIGVKDALLDVGRERSCGFSSSGSFDGNERSSGSSCASI